MKLRYLAITASLVTASACSFFEEPIDDLGAGSVPAPASRIPANTPPRLPSNNKTPATEQPSVNTLPASAQNSTNATKTYFTAASLFDVPENATNLSFVYFAESSNSRRGQAICKALTETYALTEVSDIPANAAHLIVWPIMESSSGTGCTDMLANYESIDISNETAKNIKENSDGPFLMTKNTPERKRLIYDLSGVKTRTLPKTLIEWEQVIKGAAADWPAYQSAR